MTATELIPYESRLNADFDWALREGSMHFEEESSVQKTLRRITKRLEEIGVPYALVGGMALFYHGFRRFTEDVDMLVTSEGLAIIHEKLEGLGYLPPFQGSKNLRDTETGVKIEFLVAGGYPGDGLPKPISFPDPSLVGIILNGFKVVSLPTLIELKIASGTAPGRLKDLGDVEQLIRTMNLPQDFSEQLDPSVHDTFLRLWHGVHISRQEP